MNPALQRQNHQRLIESRRWLKLKCPELSARELSVVRLLSYGKTRKEIAGSLFISPLTVDSHIKNIYDALGLHKETELTRWYIYRCHHIKEESMFLDFVLIIFYLIEKLINQ